MAAFTGGWDDGRQTIVFAGRYRNPAASRTSHFTSTQKFRFLNSKERDMTEFEKKKAIALMILALLGGFIFFCS